MHVVREARPISKFSLKRQCRMNFLSMVDGVCHQLMKESKVRWQSKNALMISPHRHTRWAAVLELLPSVWRKSGERFEYLIQCDRPRGLTEEDRKEGAPLFPTLASWSSPLQRGEDTKSTLDLKPPTRPFTNPVQCEAPRLLLTDQYPWAKPLELTGKLPLSLIFHP